MIMIQEYISFIVLYKFHKCKLQLKKEWKKCVVKFYSLVVLKLL